MQVMRHFPNSHHQTIAMFLAKACDVAVLGEVHLAGILGHLANLSSKCNGCGLEFEEYLVRGEVAKTLAGTMV